MDKVLALLQHYYGILTANYGLALTVLGVLFMIAKAVSTEKAPIVVAQVQKFFDSIAKALSVLGTVFQKVADLLADVLRSNGLFGKQ